MLFHVTHTHDYQTCMAHREEARNEFNDGFTKAAAANNVQILATLIIVVATRASGF